MKRLFALIFALVICLTAFTACGGQPSEAVQETTEKAKLTDEVTRIKTPYAEICVPKSFENNVKNTVTKESPYTVAFTSVKDDTQLFEVVFNGKGSVLMGTIVGDEGNTVLYMNVPALKKDSPNFNENLAYQQGVNTITNHLQEDYDFRVNEEVVEKEDGSLEVDASMQLQELLEKYDIPNTYDADTVGGWVAEMLEKVPEPKDSFVVNGHRFTVTEMDGFRVTHVVVSPEPEKAPDAEETAEEPEKKAE